MRRFHLFVLAAAALAAAGCALRDPALAGAPAYAPANAAPPAMVSATSDLVGPAWQWRRTDFAEGRTVVAAAPERYTIAFEAGGRLLLRADCNRGSTRYAVDGSAMKIGPAMVTKMGCPPDSQGGEFLVQLERVATYGIDGAELALTLADGAAMRFARAP